MLPIHGWILICALTVSVLNGCNKANPTSSAGQDLVLTGAEQEIVSLSNAFAFKLFGQSQRELGTDNALVSPLSIQAALAMVWQGARGETKTAIERAIGLESIDTDLVNAYFKKLIDDLPRLDPQTKLEIANSIWYRQHFEVIPAFLDVNRQIFSAEVHAMDFSDPASVDRINQWVNNKTNGKIDKIVEQLEGDLVMLLLNAVYFKGSWAHAFDERETQEGDFYLDTDSGAPRRVSYMQTEHAFPMMDHALFEAVALAYGNNKYSMVALRPRDGVSVAELVELFSAPGQWDSLLGPSSAQERTVKLHVPKFKFSYSNTLNDELEALGMGMAFSDAADFSGISENGKLAISEVKHKSFIEVNEEGTEAAAVTSVEVLVTSLPVVPVFKLDRPFLFAIRENSTGLLVFLGQINDPNSSATEL